MEERRKERRVKRGGWRETEKLYKKVTESRESR